MEYQSINNCENLRDRAMIDFLLSTGIRVGELVRLNIEDIDFSDESVLFMEKAIKSEKHILMQRPSYI